MLLISCIVIFTSCSGADDTIFLEGDEVIVEDITYLEGDEAIGEDTNSEHNMYCVYDDCIDGNIYYDNTENLEPFERFVDINMPYSTISAGAFHSASIMPNGTLWAWGFNGLGQIGDGTWDNRYTPVQTGVYTDWVSVNAGQHFTIALRDDGSLWSWGTNQRGSLGFREIPPGGIPDGWVDVRYNPTQIGTDTDWVNFSVGHMFVIAIRSDGSLWGWGSNSWRQLGGGDLPYWNDMSLEWEPIQIGTCTDWVYVSAGANHVMGLKSDGSLWGWGDNSYGRIGDGNLEGWGPPNSLPRHDPIRIGTDTDWISISAGVVHTMGLKADGTLWAWGANGGALGDGTTEDRAAPIQIGTDSDWISISAGVRHSMALKADGSLWGWGVNFDGQLGYGPLEIRNRPIRILENVVEVSAGTNNTIALLSDGSLWAWGANRNGQLGDGTTDNHLVPVRIIESTHP